MTAKLWPMTRWHEVDDALVAALERDTAERPAFIAKQLAEEDTLRRRVESLLAGLEGAEEFLEPPATPLVESRIGAYLLDRVIGHGGSSVVYLARRDDQEYQGRVALKLIQHGRHMIPLLHRFRTERQILADFDHPYIARLFDGGTTRDGRPYFVMEMVEGFPIDRYCDQYELSEAERIVLFCQVCEAVQYAHRRLVVHRDLKPANILVNSEGVPKLLDFGIAKVLDPHAFPHTVEDTQPGARPMTPRYASPEQLEGRPITTATDVFSLGLLLHRLLTGRLPADREPPFTNRDGEEAPVRVLKAELNHIVAMALHEDPERRYSSVEQLADDLRRYLGGLPVRARADTLTYRTVKFIRRHTAAVTIAAVVFTILVAFGVSLWAQVQRTTIALEEAQRERGRAEHILGFVLGIFEISDPAEAQGSEVTARQLLDRGAEQLESLADQPRVQAAAFDTIGRIYGELAYYDQAQDLLERGLEIRREQYPAGHLELIDSLVFLGRVLAETGDHQRAEALHREALEIRRQSLEDGFEVGKSLEVATSLRDLATSLHHQGRFKEAEEFYIEALEIRRRELGAEHPDVAPLLSDLGNLLQIRGAFLDAETHFRSALAISRRHLGEDHPVVATMHNNLAVSLLGQEKHAEAEEHFRRALDKRRRLLGSDHPGVAAVLANLGASLSRQGEFEEAEEGLREALQIRLRHFGEVHRTVSANLSVLGSLRRQQGDPEGAVGFYRRSLEVGRRVAAGNPVLAEVALPLGQILVEQGQFADAEPYLREAYTLRREGFPAGNPRIAEAALALGDCLLTQGHDDEAGELFQESHRIYQKAGEPFAAETEKARHALERLRSGI